MQREEGPGGDLKSASTAEAGCVDGAAAPLVRSDILQGLSQIVEGFGGEPAALLEKLRINPAILESDDGLMPYRSFVNLLEYISAELDCPDLGMRLAVLQGCRKILGPMAVAMKNSTTLGNAFQYAVRHTQAYYSAAVRTRLDEVKRDKSVRLVFQILLSGVPHQRQATEQALLLAANNALYISGGRVKPNEIWFKHKPLAKAATYRENFGTNVLFDQVENALVFAADDFVLPNPDADEQLYMLAANYVDNNLPKLEVTFSTHVRSLVERLFKAGDFSYDSVANDLGMHARTLRRRLHCENTTLEQIRDDVRRDMALHYLQGTSLPLTEIVKLLGFSEASVLSRNCRKWYGAMPKELRRGSARPLDPT